MANNMTETIRYPHFIQSKPCGIDKFEGQSHKRLTDAIANHILSTDTATDINLSRIIGLEGGWGVGKTNIIKQLDEVLKDKYYLFEYDAWGHQEDLQRRSFLELLTAELINEADILEKKKWGDKLKDLLAKKVTRVNKAQPKFDGGALGAVLALAFTSITVFISERLEAAEKVCNILYLTLFAFSPIILGLFLWLISSIFNKNMRGLSYLLQISKNENVQTENYETINEDDPTVAKFKLWMKDISNEIKIKNKRRLIVVFDNMDRLPAEKVKDLWSSIHTFFSENGFENIWVIIPFDEKHLSCAFNESGNDIKLTKYFISKTFPIVYRVTPPIITDFKKIFNDLFEEAFAKTESDSQEIVNRIFRLENLKATETATVRDMIIFINQLVALKTIWEDKIDILSMTIFTLKKDKLFTDTVNQILSGEYLGDHILKVIPNNENLQKNIAALTYGIFPDDAEQIPISKFIESCLKSEDGYDINKYLNHKHFLSVLKDKISDTDVPLDTLIKGLSKLDTSFEEQNKDSIVILWDNIAKQKVIIKLVKQEFNDIFKILLLHISIECRNVVIKYLCDELQCFKEFSGENYYISISGLDKYIKENSLDIPITLKETEINPEIFIDYVSVAEKEYSLYKLNTNPDKLDYFLANSVFNTTDNETIWVIKRENDFNTSLSHDMMIKVLRNLKINRFSMFPKLLEKIEEAVKNNGVTNINFKMLFDAYKLLSDEKPLNNLLNSTTRQNILNAYSSKTDTPEYLEIVIMQIANGINVGGTFNEEQIKNMANNIDYYASGYGDLLLKNISWGITILNQVLKYMTENKIGHRMAIEEVLPMFFKIKKSIDVTEIVLLDQFDRWREFILKINKDNIQTIVPDALFFKFSVLTKNTLTAHLNKTVVIALSEVPSDSLYQQLLQTNNYWIIVIEHLIGSEFLTLLPDNLVDFGKKLLKDIASNNISVPAHDNIFQKIIEKIDKKETAAIIKDIRDDFCNSRCAINVKLFLYFAQWFEQQGDLLSRSPDVVHKIIEPVINDDICLGIIVSNKDYYAKIINNAGDDATGIIKQIKEKLQAGENDELKKFAKKIIKE
jgi:hypothetical protein